jgi:hypothetical protein
MKATPTLRKIKTESAPTSDKRVIDCTLPELVDAVLERFPDTLIAYLVGSIKPPPEVMTRSECAELLRISTAQLDILSRRDVDPIPFEVCGESRRYVRADVHSWLRMQRKAVR